MVERALEKGYWKTDRNTPAATIYAAIQPSQPRPLPPSRSPLWRAKQGRRSGLLREIQKKGDEARAPRRVNFRKAARGEFKLAK